MPQELYGPYPSAKSIARENLINGVLFQILPIIPALALIVAGLFSTIGRFSLTACAVGSGARRVYAATAVIAIGRTLLGVALVCVVIWSVIDPKTVYMDGVVTLNAIAGGFMLAMYVGLLSEVLALPGLALLAWHKQLPDEHRHRIGLAAAFYPAIAIVWFVITLTLALIGIFLPDLQVIAIVIQACLFIAMQVLQYLVVTKAYRFPPEPQPEAPKPE